MKILFARVGFMKFYQGPKLGDEKPIGGGSYNTEEIGHEVYNFRDINGIMYGYFQPHMKPPYEINLGRIVQGCADDKIDNVLVIWFVTNPILYQRNHLERFSTLLRRTLVQLYQHRE